MPLPPPTWSLDDGSATHARDGLRVTLDVSAPDAGLVVSGVDGCADHLLGVRLGASRLAGPTDRWLRGADLTAVYEPVDARRLRATALWRIRPGQPPAWELVLSAQTSLGESDAALAVVSVLAGEDVQAAAPGGCWRPVTDGVLTGDAVALLVRRGRHATRSVLVAVHPGDARRVSVGRGDGRTRIECGVFSSAIEKGVLLRSRMLAAVGPAQGDEAWAAAMTLEFAASPPVLQT